MASTSRFPFRSRVYYLCYALADRLLPRRLFLQFFGDASTPPRPLPGTPQVWLEAVAGNNWVAWKDATLILGGLEQQDGVDPAPFLLALKSEEEDVVFWSLIALGRIGEPAKSGMAEIAAALNHRAFGIRQSAITTLARLGIREDSVQETILVALDDTDPFVRAEAVRALEQAGPLRQHIVAKLRALLRDPDEDVRHYTQRCLERLE